MSEKSTNRPCLQETWKHLISMGSADNNFLQWSADNNFLQMQTTRGSTWQSFTLICLIYAVHVRFCLLVIVTFRRIDQKMANFYYYRCLFCKKIFHFVFVFNFERSSSSKVESSTLVREQDALNATISQYNDVVLLR